MVLSSTGNRKGGPKMGLPKFWKKTCFYEVVHRVLYKLASPRFWWVTYTVLPTKISEDVRFNQEVFRFDKVTIFLPDNGI